MDIGCLPEDIMLSHQNHDQGSLSGHNSHWLWYGQNFTLKFCFWLLLSTWASSLEYKREQDPGFICMDPIVIVCGFFFSSQILVAVRLTSPVFTAWWPGFQCPPSYYFEILWCYLLSCYSGLINSLQICLLSLYWSFASARNFPVFGLLLNSLAGFNSQSVMLCALAGSITLQGSLIPGKPSGICITSFAESVHHLSNL